MRPVARRLRGLSHRPAQRSNWSVSSLRVLTTTTVIPAGIAITGVTWVNVALVTMRQRLAPPEQMGRVIAASRTFAWAGLPLGAAIGGLLAGWFGVVPVYIGGSAGVLIVAALLTQTALFRDRVMGFTRHGAA